MLKQKIKNTLHRIKSLRKRYYIIGVVAIVFVTLSISALWPRSVQFSYQESSCISQAVIFPGLMKSVRSNDFTVTAKDVVSIGKVPLYSDQLCVNPDTPPRPGKHTVAFAPFGLSLLGRNISVDVTPYPVATVVGLDKPIAVTKHLTIPLDQPDDIFGYKISVGDQNVECGTKGMWVSCDLPKLKLDQGAEYPLSLDRYYQKAKVSTIASKKVQTLAAVVPVESSIKAGDTVYTKPKSMTVTTDKIVSGAQAKLTRTDGDKKETQVTVKPQDKSITIEWQEDLPRSASYELSVTSIDASDGSSLASPYVSAFKTSGGPKVTGVSVGRSSVALGSTAVITFDQSLSDKQDISQVVSATNGAVVSRKQGNQVMISLAAVPKCGDVSITVNDNLQSNYDIAGGSQWKFTTRMVCHSITTFGTSAKGRPLTAYTFGNGPSTVVYTGAIHGNETSTKSLMQKWIDELEVNAPSIPATTSVVVIPAINPDGVASGARVNGNNVDLNRNFGTGDWKKDITTVTNAPFAGGGGSAAMSEPETKALAGYISQLRPRLILSYHSIGGVIAANQTGSSTTYARTYSGLSGYRDTTGSGTTFEYAVSGTADDYYGERLGIASILIELGSHTYHQFERNQKAMWAMLK